MELSPSSKTHDPMLIRYLNTHPLTRIKIVSGSMRPVISVGDYIIVDQLKRKVWPGDILLCYNDNIFYAHRLIMRKNDKWYLKGDGADELDPPIKKKSIIGRVVEIRSSKNKKKHDFMKYIILFHEWAFIFIAKLKQM